MLFFNMVNMLLSVWSIDRRSEKRAVRRLYRQVWVERINILGGQAIHRLLLWQGGESSRLGGAGRVRSVAA